MGVDFPSLICYGCVIDSGDVFNPVKSEYIQDTKERKESEDMLPQEFCGRMKEMLGEEYPAFMETYEREKYQALRLNPLKGSREHFFEKAQVTLAPVPWCADGFYYEDGDGNFRPGKHPYHEAGVYYIQEPSAMAPAAYLGALPGMRVLDLCAAPGGKSTQIAAGMKGEGILISNEIHPARAKILSENVERMGIRNAIVVNETPQRLSAVFEEYFDRIMVDAPCSGEGMFRKNGEAANEWSPENVDMCARRQDEILEEAYRMLAPGGRMVYSTCTFAPAEDEGSMERFLDRHGDMRLVPVELFPGMESGALEHTIRLWPHKLKGEGHFVTVLEKAGETAADEGGEKRRECRNGVYRGLSPKSCREFFQFAKETLQEIPEGIFAAFGDQLYLLPEGSPDLKGLKVLRPGLHLGTNKKNRFEPAHALALALAPEEAVHRAELSGSRASEYVNGQTFPWEGDKGWYLITLDDYSLGWGKLAGGIMKNHYPKGLRKNLRQDPCGR